MRELARAINALADRHEALRREVEARIADAQKRMHEERDRLAAASSPEATQAVLVCNLEERILLTGNRQASSLGTRRADTRRSRRPASWGSGDPCSRSSSEAS